MTTAQSVELMAGLTFLVFGLSYLLNTHIWVDWFKGLAEKPYQSAVLVGMGHFVAGAFILSFHWVWYGVQIIVTILGLIMTFEGLVYLLYPRWLIFIFKLVEPYISSIVRISGLVVAGLAVVILFSLV